MIAYLVHRKQIKLCGELRTGLILLLVTMLRSGFLDISFPVCRFPAIHGTGRQSPCNSRQLLDIISAVDTAQCVRTTSFLIPDCGGLMSIVHWIFNLCLIMILAAAASLAAMALGIHRHRYAHKQHSSQQVEPNNR